MKKINIVSPSTRSLLTQLGKLPQDEDLLFHQLADSSPDMILITTSEGEIYYVNSAWEKLTGYTFEEVKGKNPRILSSGKTPKDIYKKLWLSLRAGKSFSTDEICDRKKDGTDYQIHSTFFSIRKNDRNIFYVQLLYDITSHSAFEITLQKNEEQLKLILDNVNGIAIIMLDLKGNITSWSSGAQRLEGYTKEEILGKHFSLFYPKDEIKNRIPWKTLVRAKKGKVEEEGLRVKKNGEYFWASVVLNPIRNERGVLKGFVKITQDITKQKELQRQKDAFIGIASHELRTPITSLNMYTQMLEKRLQQHGDTQDMQFVANIKGQSERLINLIDDLLNVSKIDSGKLELHRKDFDMHKLVEQVVTNIQYITSTHKIFIDGDNTIIVNGDENRIEQVIVNLLTNAIKYSPNANKIIIHLAIDQQNVIIAVEDFGLGIAKEDLPNVFKRFYRTKDKDQGKISGFGLGLHISSEIIKNHNGKIWVESEKRKGSTFYFSLPFIMIH